MLLLLPSVSLPRSSGSVMVSWVFDKGERKRLVLPLLSVMAKETSIRQVLLISPSQVSIIHKVEIGAVGKVTDRCFVKRITHLKGELRSQVTLSSYGVS